MIFSLFIILGAPGRSLHRETITENNRQYGNSNSLNHFKFIHLFHTNKGTIFYINYIHIKTILHNKQYEDAIPLINVITSSEVKSSINTVLHLARIKVCNTSIMASEEASNPIG